VHRCAALSFVILASCYQPDVLDCVVACSGANECAADQVCGADGWCASPEVAGQCATVSAADGGLDVATTELGVIVNGKGRVVADPPTVGCDGESPNEPVECSFAVTTGNPLTLTAVAIHHGWRFVGWAGATCGDQATETCELVVVAPVTVVAQFVRDDD
jgi:hypothetical protein